MPTTRKDLPTLDPPTHAPAIADRLPDTAAADALIAALVQDGAAGEAGQFTLSPEIARTKLRQYQLKEPVQFVLLLVQTAALRGASRLSFEFDTDDLRLVFDGQGLSREELEGVHSALFASRPGPAHASLQELALASNAAEAFFPVFLRVRSTSAGGTYELELRPYAPQVVARVDPLDWPTRVHVRFRVGDYPLDAIRQLLLTRCRYASAEIFLDRSRISRGLKLRGKLPQVPITGPDLRGVAGWSWEPEPGPGELRLVKNGVWFTTLHPPFLSLGALVVVEGDRLRKALSQDTVVQDDALSPVLEAARQGAERAREALCLLTPRQADALSPRERAAARLLRRMLQR